METPASYTVAMAIADLTTAFADAGIDSPRVDARVLVAHVLGVEPNSLFARSSDLIHAEHRAEIVAIKARRLAREPVARIRGYREFYGADYLIGPATLEPRADSETLVEAALKLRLGVFSGRPVRILDLGTGSGCLLLAILGAWPEAVGLGIDLAPEALDIARANAQRHGLADRAHFQTGNWCAGLAGSFDLIISNPPYINDCDIDGLEPEVKGFDPLLALRGGADGLAAYRALVPSLREHLTPTGVVLLEVGAGQATDVASICVAHGLALTTIHHDLAGVGRVVEMTVAK